MKKLTLFILICTCAVSGSSAQTIFHKVYGGSTTERASSIISTTDGGYLTCGSMHMPVTPSGPRQYLIKFDQNGDMVWSSIYNNTKLSAFASVCEASGGDYVACGYVNSSGHSMINITRVDSGGAIIWERTYDVNSSQSIFSATIKSTSDGGFIVSGGNNPGEALLIKIDSLGNVQWVNAYSYPGYGAFGNSLCITNDKGYVLVADLDSFNVQNIYIVKTDSAGNTVWTRYFNGNQSDAVYSVYETSASDIIIVGSTKDSVSLAKPCMIKMDNTGNVLWVKTYEAPGNSFASSFVEFPNGNYVIKGHYEPLTGSEMTFLIKTDSNGDTLWTQGYNTGNNTTSGNGNISVSHDGGYIFTESTNVINANPDIGIIKTDQNGSNVTCNKPPLTIITETTTLPSMSMNIQTPVSLIASTASSVPGFYPLTAYNFCPVGIEENESLKFSVFPNPFTDVITIDFNDKIVNDGEVNILNVSGQAVYTKLVNANSLQMDLSVLPDGIYFLRVQSDQGQLTKKIVKSRIY